MLERWDTTVPAVYCEEKLFDAMTFDGCYAVWSKARELFCYLSLFASHSTSTFLGERWGLWEMLLSCLVGWLAFMKF